MTLTAAESALYRELCQDGAGPLEAAIVLSAVRELDQIVELSYKNAYLHERRGRDGRWVRSGDSAARIKEIQARRGQARRGGSMKPHAMPPRSLAAQSGSQPHAMAARALSPAAAVQQKTIEQIAAAKAEEVARQHAEEIVTAKAEEIAARHAQEAVSKAKAVVEQAKKDIHEAGETKEKEKLHKKLIIRLGIALGAAILAIIEEKFHAGEAFAALTTISPLIINEGLKLGPEITKEIIEFRKKV